MTAISTIPVRYVGLGLKDYFLAAHISPEANDASKPRPTAQDLYDAASNAGAKPTEPEPAKRARHRRKTKYVGRHRAGKH